MSLIKKATGKGEHILNSIKKIAPTLNKNDRNYKKDKEMMKVLLKDYVDYNYSLKFSKDIQYNEMELCLFNHKGWLLGYLDDDFTSADHLLMRCAMRQPKGLLLGDCNVNDVDRFSSGMNKYISPPKIEKISGENLIGRQLFMDYFRGNFPSNICYMKEYGDYKISELDSIFKRKVFNGNLTLAYLGCYYDSMKLIFSSPNKLLHLEDLVVNYSLEEIQYAFYETVQEYLKRAKESEFTPPFNPPEFTTIIQRISQEIHTEKLFDKKCQYSAAVFRKIHKLYPDNILFMPHHLVPKTYEHITDSFCPDFDEIYRTKDFKQKLRETETDVKTLEVVLEKICILSHLVDKEFTYYMLNGNNPLKIMFAGKFSHFPDAQVRSIYTKISSMYQTELENIFFSDLKRIEQTIANGRVWTRDYRDEVQKWDKHSEAAKKLPKTEFVIDKIRKEEELAFINQLLLTQIGINIRQKEMSGKNMNLVKLNLRKLFSGLKTKHIEALFNELLVEANAQLGLLKLPSSFKKFESKLNEVLYENLEEVLGEDPQKVYQKAISKIYNQLQGIDPFIVKDGSEAEMQESMLNRNQMKLIEISDKFIFNKSDQKQSNKKSIHVNKNKNTFMKNFEEELNKIKEENIKKESKTDSANSVIDLDTIEKEENQHEKRKLELINELKSSFENDDVNNQLIPTDVLNLDLFKDKSLEELKKMDIEEVAEYDVEADEDGQISVRTLYKNENEIDRIEKEMTSDRSAKPNNLNFADLPPEKNFMTVYKSLSQELHKKDRERGMKIELALETGVYLDDPIYVQMLMTQPRFIKLREKFLQKYFTSKNNATSSVELEKLKKTKMPLLDKYAVMDGDIVKNIQKDNIFYKYDSSEGKKVSYLYKQFMNDIDEEGEENEYEMHRAEKLGTDYKMENDDEEEKLENVFEYMKDRIDELKNKKSIYYDNADFKEEGNENNLYEKGRKIKNNNKKLKSN